MPDSLDQYMRNCLQQPPQPPDPLSPQRQHQQLRQHQMQHPLRDSERPAASPLLGTGEAPASSSSAACLARKAPPSSHAASEHREGSMMPEYYLPRRNPPVSVARQQDRTRSDVRDAAPPMLPDYYLPRRNAAPTALGAGSPGHPSTSSLAGSAANAPLDERTLHSQAIGPSKGSLRSLGEVGEVPVSIDSVHASGTSTAAHATRSPPPRRADRRLPYEATRGPTPQYGAPLTIGNRPAYSGHAPQGLSAAGSHVLNIGGPGERRVPAF